MTDSQQDRDLTAGEQFKMLLDRTAKLNDIASALLAPQWGSEVGIIPPDHPLYVGERPTEQREQGAPVDWQAIAGQRERELKKVGEARHRAEQVEELLHIAHETSNTSEAARARAVQRAEQAEAAIARVQALAEQWQAAMRPGETHPAAQQIHAALGQAAPKETA